MMESRFDIVVIGAGIAGASVAAELARTNKVALLEREDMPGYHSTGRSAALFSEIYGNEPVRALSRASRDFFFNTPDGFSPTPLVKPRGSLHIAAPAQLSILKDFAASPDVAASVRLVSAEEALRLCPILKPEQVVAAVIEDDAADVDVNALHQGYLRQFQGFGGTLVLNAFVRTLRHEKQGWRIETERDVFSASVVVNAAGAWADSVAEMAGAQPLNIQPCRRTAILVELPPGIAPDAWPMVIDIEESFYMKPDAGLLLVSPADETPVAPSDVQPEELDVAIAVDRIETATSLQVKRIRKRWAGLRSFAPDRSPVIGFDPSMPGFFWLAGQGGYGIQTAPAASKLASALLRGEMPSAEGNDLVAQLSPSRFAQATARRSRA